MHRYVIITFCPGSPDLAGFSPDLMGFAVWVPQLGIYARVFAGICTTCFRVTSQNCILYIFMWAGKDTLCLFLMYRLARWFQLLLISWTTMFWHMFSTDVHGRTFRETASKMIHQRIFKRFPKYNIHLIRNDRLVCIFIDLYQQSPDEPGAAVSKGEVYYKQGKQFAWICEVKGVDCPVLKNQCIPVLHSTTPYCKYYSVHFRTTKYSYHSILQSTTPY